MALPVEPPPNGNGFSGTPQPEAPITLKAGERVYISTQDDWWDTIAMRVYGMQRGNERLMYRLLEANYPLRNISHFPAGVAVIVPQVPVVTEIPLVPWKKASVLPAEP